jgi:hypothetical protein
MIIIIRYILHYYSQLHISDLLSEPFSGWTLTSQKAMYTIGNNIINCDISLSIIVQVADSNDVEYIY